MTATSTIEATGDGEHQPGPETGLLEAPAPGGTADDLGLAFAFDHGRPGREHGERGELFRFPAADDAGPGPRRLLAMSLYTALVGLVALAVTLRGLLVIIGGDAPGWYQPAFVVAGLVGVGFVVGAFLSIHRRRLPWLMLAAAAVPLAANIVITVGAA